MPLKKLNSLAQRPKYWLLSGLDPRPHIHHLPLQQRWAEIRVPHVPNPNEFPSALHSSCYWQKHDLFYSIRTAVMDSTMKWGFGSAQPTYVPDITRQSSIRTPLFHGSSLALCHQSITRGQKGWEQIQDSGSQSTDPGRQKERKARCNASQTTEDSHAFCIIWSALLKRNLVQLKGRQWILLLLFPQDELSCSL